MESKTSWIILGGIALAWALLRKGDESKPGGVSLWELATPEEYRELVSFAAQKHGVPAELIVATAIVESHWDSDAVRYEPRLGESSMGIMQILPSTARSYGYIGENDWLLDPLNSLDWGAHILMDLWQKHRGNVPDIVAAYNAGEPRRKADGSYINQAHVNKVMNEYVKLLSFSQQ